jgi:hypothetical protein
MCGEWACKIVKEEDKREKYLFRKSLGNSLIKVWKRRF